MEDASNPGQSAGDETSTPVVPTDIATTPPIAGFWRRFVAFFIDWLALGIVGQLIALPFYSFWCRLGPYGRFVGFPIALMYFGLTDSSVAGGQSIGKRVLALAVRNADGQAISANRAFLRTLVWLVPLMLNGWALPIMSEPIIAGATSIIVFGVGGALCMTLVFNRRTRQGLHDMLSGTFVLHLSGQPVNALPTPTRRQWMLPGVVMVVAVLFTIGGFAVSRSVSSLQNVLQLQRVLQRDNRFFSVGVSDQTLRVFGGEATRTLEISAWFKGVPTETERTSIMNDLAKQVLDQHDLAGFDFIRIEVISAYDVGLAHGHRSNFDSERPSTWRVRIDDLSLKH